MPTYEYECPDCGHAFELFQSMTAKVKRTCPECGSRNLKRLIGTGGAVLFKRDRLPQRGLQERRQGGRVEAQQESRTQKFR